MTHQGTFYYYLILFIILCQKAMYNWMLSAGLFSLLKTDMSQWHGICYVPRMCMIHMSMIHIRVLYTKTPV